MSRLLLRPKMPTWLDTVVLRVNLPPGSPLESSGTQDDALSSHVGNMELVTVVFYIALSLK